MMFVGARGGEGQRRCSPSRSRRPEQVITAPVVPLLLLPLPLLRLHGRVARRRCRYCLAEQPVTVPATLVISLELHRRNHQLKGLITAAPAWWICPALLHCDLADKLTSWLFLSPHAIGFSPWHPSCSSIDQRNRGDLCVSSRCGRRSAASADAVN